MITAEQTKELTDQIRKFNSIRRLCKDDITKSILRAVSYGKYGISIVYKESEDKHIKEELDSLGFETDIIKTKLFDELIIRW